MNEGDIHGTSIKITFSIIVASDSQSWAVQKVNLNLFLYDVQESYKYYCSFVLY
jgi:hypothetical protein